MDDLREAQPDRAPGLLPERGRRRDAVNKLLCVLAVAGIGLSLWAFVQEVVDLRARSESRERITEACGGLVDPDPVLGLNGGGIDRVKLSDEHETDLGERSSGCLVYRVGDPGTTYGHFSLAVLRRSAEPDAEETAEDETTIDEDSDEPFRRPYGDEKSSPGPVVRHALPHPLGDGALGEYDEYKVTARAVCAKGGKVSSIEVSAVARYDEPVTAEDRRTLAGLARQGADRAADRTGCLADLPELPATLAEPGTEFGSAARTGGTCDWYRRFLTTEERGSLPDRALGAPAGRASAHDACVLAVGEKETRRIYPGFVKTSDYPQTLDDVLKYLPWWVKTETYVGDGTRGLRAEDFEQKTELTPGTAGTDSDRTWWASSVCYGRPAVHVLWVAYPYDRIAADRLEPLFRAYVDDVTERRGCTDVVLPGAKDFARS